MMKSSEPILRVFTRNVEEGRYPDGLAYSVHIELIKEGQNIPVRNNYGMLFPKATIDERNVIVPSFVNEVRVSPFEYKGEKRYLISGIDCLKDGSENQKSIGYLYGWVTKDFICFDEMGLVSKEEIEELTGMTVERLRMTDSVPLSKETADNMCGYWNQLSFESFDKENGLVTYSDGSVHKKNLAEYPNLKFPLARGFGDPVILLWNDEYYYIATNDNLNDIGLYVRKAHRLDDLFSDDVKMHLILDKDEKRGFVQTFWAPEFHVIGGNLYILFAVSNENWGPRCHMMKLKEGGDILKAEDWEEPVRVLRKGGLPLGQNGITLDMTYVKSGDRHYYVWSYREHIGSPLDSGSMLMIGEFSPEKPDELISEPLCLSRPLYGFENVRGTINNEGPYAFYHGNKIYLAYSGGDARGYLYTVGMLTANDGDDLLDLAVWEKSKTPALSLASINGEYGPGHNSFFKDRDGNWWIAYHCVDAYEERVIADGFRRIHFDINDRPRFDLSREEDFPEEFRENNIK